MKFIFFLLALGTVAFSFQLMNSLNEWAESIKDEDEEK